MESIYPLVLLDVAVIVVMAGLFGNIARRLGQPPVIGEVIAGIALGPSLLGLLPGHLDTRLFPHEVMPSLKLLAHLGLVLFAFAVGLELDLSRLRGRLPTVASISVLSFFVPFGLGLLVGFVLYPMHSVVDGKTVEYAILLQFMGIAMSITAFPILARILIERNVHRTKVGVLALSAAAVDDIFGWIFLAFVVAVAKGDRLVAEVQAVILCILFTGLMFGVVRPLLSRMLRWRKKLGGVVGDVLATALVLVGVLLAAFITQRIGLHEIFGGFLFGVIMPREGPQQLRREIFDRIADVNMRLFLPVFFVIAGFGINLRAFTQVNLVWQLLLILAAAVIGKLVGAFAGARLQRVSVQHSAAIAVLMNTRGLTELVVLSVGKEFGIFDTAMFTMMVMMALATTFICQPVLRKVYPDEAVQADIAADAALEFD